MIGPITLSTQQDHAFSSVSDSNPQLLSAHAAHRSNSADKAERQLGDSTNSPVNLLVISPEFVSCNEIPPHVSRDDVAHGRRLLGRLRRRRCEKREPFHSNNAPSCAYTSIKL